MTEVLDRLRWTRLIGGPRDGEHHALPEGRTDPLRFIEAPTIRWWEDPLPGPMAPLGPEHLYLHRSVPFAAGGKRVTISVWAHSELTDEDVAWWLLTHALRKLVEA